MRVLLTGGGTAGHINPAIAVVGIVIVVAAVLVIVKSKKK